MPSITSAEADALRRRAGAAMGPVKQPGELLAIFVTGKLANPLNGTPWIWQKRSRYARSWKERVGNGLLESAWWLDQLYLHPETPKRVSIHASLWNWMDGDGLQAACKPIRDALVECGVVSGDAERDGHEWIYSQKIDRARRGVEIRISLRGGA
jgi:hypothetical protein